MFADDVGRAVDLVAIGDSNERRHAHETRNVKQVTPGRPQACPMKAMTLNVGGVRYACYQGELNYANYYLAPHFGFSQYE
jgi:hypothetical protein